MAIGSSSGVLAWSPGYDDIGAHAVEVEAREPGDLAAAQRFDLAVEARFNRPPRIVSDPPASAAGSEWTCQAATADPDGDSLSWFLVAGPPGMAIDAATGLLAWTPAPGLAPSVAIWVEDGRGSSARQSFALTFLFLGGEAIPLPGEKLCGRDPTEDPLSPCRYPEESCKGG